MGHGSGVSKHGLEADCGAALPQVMMELASLKGQHLLRPGRSEPLSVNSS
jgi:hypothetical protein